MEAFQQHIEDSLCGQPHNDLRSIPPQCCCGRPECAFLGHSKKLLDELERDTRRAGEAGMALLTRHESYVADAEEDRQRMEEKMARLELEKRKLEGRNAQTVEENRSLLDQLESLNTACAESELKVLSMTELLRSTDQELERLAGLAARTEGLQIQLVRLEDEQQTLHTSLATTKEEERSLRLRWHNAERTVVSLQDQIEKIELDARMERERHNEVVGRMERRRMVEAELRKKTVTARNSLPPEENSGNVVSHFVKDILQDNANLQLGIVELKELLDRSNEEVERLRLVMEQPDLPSSPIGPTTPSLGAELSAKELHVHHHYHAPTITESPRAPRSQIRRIPRRKRTGLTSGSTSGTHTPRSSISAIHSPIRASTTSAILSQTSVTIPQQRIAGTRWSVQSNQTGFTSSSSLPSSPYNESVFDRVFSDIATDMSRPTSPESSGALSPYAIGSVDGYGYPRSDSIPRLSLDAGMRSSSEGTVTLSQQLSRKGKGKRDSYTPDFDAWQAGHSTILEENEDLDLYPQDHFTQAGSDDQSGFSPQRMYPKLRRATSHESLISVSGMDIYTLRSRPSQLLAGRRVLSSSPVTATSQAALSGASALATRPTISQVNKDSRSYLSGIAASQRRPVKKASIGNLGQTVGGWVRGKWGYSAAAPPTSTPTDAADADAISITSTATSTKSTSSVVKVKPIPAPRIVMRPPGINQSGPIFGFAPEPKLPRTVIATTVDEEALRECLENG